MVVVVRLEVPLDVNTLRWQNIYVMTIHNHPAFALCLNMTIQLRIFGDGLGPPKNNPY